MPTARFEDGKLLDDLYDVRTGLRSIQDSLESNQILCSVP